MLLLHIVVDPFTPAVDVQDAAVKHTTSTFNQSAPVFPIILTLVVLEGYRIYGIRSHRTSWNIIKIVIDFDKIGIESGIPD